MQDPMAKNVRIIQDDAGPTGSGYVSRHRGRVPSPHGRRDVLGWIGGLIVLFFFLVAVFAAVISPYGATEGRTVDRLATLGTPGHIFGTDTQGRDMLTRLVYGTRPALVLTFLPVTLAAALGLALGSIAGSSSRFLGALIMRSMDVLFGLPPVMLSILVSVSLGPGLRNMVITLAIVLVPAMTRVAYQSVTIVMRLPYIEAAVSTGARRHDIVLKQLLPNIAAPVIAYGVSVAGAMVVLGAGLSFLGIGIQPPQPDWGTTINEGQSVVAIAPHIATLAGGAVFLLALGCNLLGDSLRDLLDPRLKI